MVLSFRNGYMLYMTCDLYANTLVKNSGCNSLRIIRILIGHLHPGTHGLFSKLWALVIEYMTAPNIQGYQHDTLILATPPMSHCCKLPRVTCSGLLVVSWLGRVNPKTIQPYSVGFQEANAEAMQALPAVFNTIEGTSKQDHMGSQL